MKKNNEDVFYKIAKSYAETDGGKLKKELDVLENKVNISGDFERRVYRGITNKSVPRRVLFMAAAVLTLLLVGVSVFNNLYTQKSNETSDAPLNGEYAAETDIPYKPETALIPISFELPENLTVSKVSEDNGETVYYLAESGNDDVILTAAEYNPDVEFSYREVLTEIKINGVPVYAAAKPDYSIFIFIKNEIKYTMTCRHDYNTLLEICEKIL